MNKFIYRKYLTYQEYEVAHIIPSVRKAYAFDLVMSGMSYEKAGKILMVSKACICQYMHHQRGNSFLLSKEITSDIEKSARKVFEGKALIQKEFAKILNKIKITLKNG